MCSLKTLNVWRREKERAVFYLTALSIAKVFVASVKDEWNMNFASLLDWYRWREPEVLGDNHVSLACVHHKSNMVWFRIVCYEYIPDLLRGTKRKIGKRLGTWDLEAPVNWFNICSSAWLTQISRNSVPCNVHICVQYVWVECPRY
jgi:hypothetical protein